ncbi:MAG TPA: 2-amino-4-hydroxy-6-hydroxymethyldihydropteridine diphosphokinase [Candidatus Kapabacteria bacterium]|nr:2-amino-4-hydroxy-6-hydroxymethyldihydropteridine diphosphokinase [Candidatus Kapabacteria bacterium]
MEEVYLSLGSNIGNKKNFLKSAIHLLQTNKGIDVVSVSSLYFSEPIGYSEQETFINLALKIKTSYEQFELLSIIKQIELSIGRQQRARWHEREIDIDIILYGNIILESTLLNIPHISFRQRRFVLMPLAEIAPLAIDPVTNKNISELLAECADNSQVLKI